MSIGQITSQFFDFFKLAGGTIGLAGGVGYLGARYVSTVNPFIGAIGFGNQALMAQGTSYLLKTYLLKDLDKKSYEEIDTKFLLQQTALIIALIASSYLSPHVTILICRSINLPITFGAYSVLQRKIGGVIFQAAVIGSISYLVLIMLGIIEPPKQ